jgi:acetylxylan esterase
MLLTSILLLVSSFTNLSQAAYSQVTNFGSNPSGAKMYLYTPPAIASRPAIIVAIHYCSGTAQAYYQNSPYARLADQHGFIVIYPESPYSGTCWDVSSSATLKHDGGANSNSIANMVKYTISTYNADASRVFVTGTSSGAMMTNVLAATYPDIFAAGIAYAGVPAGCFYTGTVNGWNSSCSSGAVNRTPQQWANVVYDAYPGYTGSRPKMQIYHGSADSTLSGNNYGETIKQWSGVFGYTNPVQTLPNTPASPFTKNIYGPKLEGMLGAGLGHSIPIFGEEDLKWFGIIGGGTNPPPTSTGTTTTTRATTTTTSTVPTTSGQPQWAQCGGNNWDGPKTCASPFTCTRINDWYHQCL